MAYSKTIKVQTDSHNYRLFLRWRMFTVIFARDGVQWKLTWTTLGRRFKRSYDLYTERGR